MSLVFSSALVNLSWHVPAGMMAQPVIVCVEADNQEFTSPPHCLVFRVLPDSAEVRP